MALLTSKLYIKLHPHLVTFMYVTTFFDYLIGCKLGKVARTLQVTLSSCSLLSGLYIALLLKLTQEGCQPHRWTRIFPEWLPHLKHSSRILAYSIVFCLTLLTTSLRAIVLIRHLKGTRLRYSFAEFYITTKNRLFPKKDKLAMLMRDYIALKRLPYFVERLKPNERLLHSTCMFWFAETFGYMDSILLMLVLESALSSMLVNAMFLVHNLYLIHLPVSPSAPFAWQLAEEDPSSSNRTLIKFEDGLCQVQSTWLNKVLFSIMICVVVSDIASVAFMMNTLLTFGGSMLIIWLRRVQQQFKHIVHLRELQHKLALQDRQLAIDYLWLVHDKPKVASTPREKYSFIDELREFDCSSATGMVTHSTTHESPPLVDECAESNNQMQLIKIPLGAFGEPRGLFDLGCVEATTGRVDIVEVAARNEILSLVQFVIDSDVYISFISSLSIWGACIGLVAFYANYRSSNTFRDNLPLFALVLSCFAALTVTMGLCSTVNAYLIKLNRQISLFVAYSPSNSEIRLFWRRLSTVLYTRRGLVYGHTIMGITKASWSHYVQVISWLLTLILVTWDHR